MPCGIDRQSDRRSARAGLSMTRRETALRVPVVCAELPRPGEPATLAPLARQIPSFRSIRLEFESKTMQVLSVYGQAVDAGQGARSRRSAWLAVPYEGGLAHRSTHADPRQSPMRETSTGVRMATTDPHYPAVKPFGAVDYASDPLRAKTLFAAATRNCSRSPRKRGGP